MDSPPKLTGETLIVHHIPLVHCQVPDRQCCGGAGGGGGGTRANPFCPPELGLTQPDHDLGQADSLLYPSLHSAPGAPTGSSDSVKSRSRDGRGPGAPKRHNPFLVQEGVGETGLGDLHNQGRPRQPSPGGCGSQPRATPRRGRLHRQGLALAGSPRPLEPSAAVAQHAGAPRTGRAGTARQRRGPGPAQPGLPASAHPGPTQPLPLGAPSGSGPGSGGRGRRAWGNPTAS